MVSKRKAGNNMSRLRPSLFTPIKVMALALVCLLTFSMTAHTNPSPARLASPPTTATPKDETIFATLGNDGALLDVQVVNTFRSVRGTIVDYGDYTEVTNLSDLRPIAHSAGRILMALDEGTATTFRYQGRLQNAALPWLFSFTYQLDGRLIPADELLGQSGLLTITVAVQPNPLALRHFSDHYTVQVVVPLLVDRSSEVQAEGASTMLVGNRLNLAFTVMPGESLTQSITAEVHDFALPPIEISALRMAPPQGERLDELDSGFAGLVGGMESVIDGTATLREGLIALHAGVGELSGALDPMMAHAGQFAEGLQQSAVGVAALSAGLTGIYDGQSALNAGDRLLAESLPTIQSGYASLAAGSEAVLAESARIHQLATALSGSPDPLVQQLAQVAMLQLTVLENLQQGLTQANAGLDDYARARTQIARESEKLLQGLELANNAAQSLTTGLNQVSQAGTSLIDGLADLPQGISAIHTSTATLPQHMGELVSGQRYIQRGISQAHASIGEFLGGGSPVGVVSFASPELAKATSVQFVMVTAPIEAAPRTRLPEEHATPTTLWQRIVALARHIVDLF